MLTFIPQVPLDYAEAGGSKASIAVAKLPSKYSSNEAEYRGPIFYNPVRKSAFTRTILIYGLQGGPGGSGVGFIRGAGPLVSSLFGDEYDHIGFDPRGMKRPASSSEDQL